MRRRTCFRMRLYAMGVDLDEVWNVIEKDLPRLKETVQAMQEESDA